MRDYSFSRLNLFESCAMAFKLKYIDKLPEAPSEAMAFGGLIHKIIAAYSSHCLECGVQTDVSEIPNIVQRCFYDKPAGIDSSRFGDVLAMAQYFADTHIANIQTLVGSEEWMQTWLEKKFLFRGIVDRLDIKGDMATITDYKTDHQLRPESEVANDFQLAVYAWLVSLEYPQIKTFNVQLDFVRHNVQRGTTLEKAQLARVSDQIVGLIGQVEQAISKKKFPPKPGHFCGWCGYSASCPAAKDIPADVKPITQAEDARKAAEELAILERQVAVRKDALKSWCNQFGNVEANGLTWGFFKTNGQSIEDVDGFVRLMNEAGMDPRPYLSTNGTKMKKLWNDPRVADGLKSLIVDKSTTRFQSKKGGNGTDEN